MKTKTIFKTLALATMMPAMLLTTACSSDDDAVNNEINNNGKGYALPVTINVTRGGDATTRATYNETDKKLEFSAGDKLFVMGNGHPSAGQFAGTLAMVSEGIFSGTIYTQYMYTGTFDALFTGAGENAAVLLPNGYEDYQFLKISGEGYSAEVSCNSNKAVATTKAAAVEQFSLEMGVYSSGTGFALSPFNAILNFTITGLTANKNVEVYTGSPLIEGTVTTDASGTALFALSVDDGTDLSTLFLRVDGTYITVTSSSQKVEPGHIYNITRSVAPAARALSEATTDDIGKIAGADGNIYDDAATASAASTTAVAVIAYVGAAGTADASSATYKGLALALTDASTAARWSTWTEATCLTSQKTDETAAKGDMAGIANTDELVAHTSHPHAAAKAAREYNGGAHPTGTSAWFLPSAGQWEKMISAYGLTNLNTTANGYTGLNNYYWSSTECSNIKAWDYNFSSGGWGNYDKNYEDHVRACLAF